MPGIIAAVVAAIEGAGQTLDIAQFTFSVTEIEQAILAAEIEQAILAAKAEGVTIRLALCANVS